MANKTKGKESGLVKLLRNKKMRLVLAALFAIGFTAIGKNYFTTHASNKVYYAYVTPCGITGRAYDKAYIVIEWLDPNIPGSGVMVVADENGWFYYNYNPERPPVQTNVYTRKQSGDRFIGSGVYGGCDNTKLPLENR